MVAAMSGNWHSQTVLTVRLDQWAAIVKAVFKTRPGLLDTHADDCISAASPHLESHEFEAIESLIREPKSSSSESPPKSTRALFPFWDSRERGSLSVQTPRQRMDALFSEGDPRLFHGFQLLRGNVEEESLHYYWRDGLSGSGN